MVDLFGNFKCAKVIESLKTMATTFKIAQMATKIYLI